jgi:hypothetical protein
MYLKKYDLDKAIENIDKILNSFNDTWNEIETHIKTNSVDIYYNTGTNFGINISNKGIITDASRGNVQDSLATRVRINTPILDHLLLETQWIDQGKVSPEKSMWCVVKIEDIDGLETQTITTAYYNAEDDYFQCDNNDYVTGWLPADNVVM